MHTWTPKDEYVLSEWAIYHRFGSISLIRCFVFVSKEHINVIIHTYVILHCTFPFTVLLFEACTNVK